jgi:hypothetical protein
MPIEMRAEGVVESPERIPTYSNCGRKANLCVRPKAKVSPAAQGKGELASTARDTSRGVREM